MASSIFELAEAIAGFLYLNPQNRLAKKVITGITAAELIAADVGSNQPNSRIVPNRKVFSKNALAEIVRKRSIALLGEQGEPNVQR